jgi:hypothetical protein
MQLDAESLRSISEKKSLVRFALRNVGDQMSARSDYSCEIIAIIVLATLSALSHFWYIMIFACIAMGSWIAAVLLSKVAIQLKTEMLGILHHQGSHSDVQPRPHPVEMSQVTRPSFPTA